MAGHHVHYKPHAPPPLPHVPKFYAYTAKFLGATMWFWILYRIKEDGPVMFGMKHPWELHEHSHDEHGEEKH